MLARPLVAAAVLLTAGTGSLVVVGGTSAADGAVAAAPKAIFGPVAVRPAAPKAVFGPVAVRPAAAPGAVFGAAAPPLPQLPPAVTAAPGPPLGPPVGLPPMGPPGLIGPNSPPHQVRAVQRLLNRAGAALHVDGAWGPATRRAVSAVQARAGLPVSGRVGPLTLAVLR